MSDILRFPPPNASRSSDSIRARMPPIAIEYRKRASRLGRMADAEDNEAKMLPLMQQALSWILLAENDELLAANAATDDADCRD